MANFGAMLRMVDFGSDSEPAELGTVQDLWDEPERMQGMSTRSGQKPNVVSIGSASKVVVSKTKRNASSKAVTAVEGKETKRKGSSVVFNSTSYVSPPMTVPGGEQRKAEKLKRKTLSDEKAALKKIAVAKTEQEWHGTYRSKCLQTLIAGRRGGGVGDGETVDGKVQLVPRYVDHDALDFVVRLGPGESVFAVDNEYPSLFTGDTVNHLSLNDACKGGNMEEYLVMHMETTGPYNSSVVLLGKSKTAPHTFTVPALLPTPVGGLGSLFEVVTQNARSKDDLFTYLSGEDITFVDTGGRDVTSTHVVVYEDKFITNHGRGKGRLRVSECPQKPSPKAHPKKRRAAKLPTSSNVPDSDTSSQFDRYNKLLRRSSGGTKKGGSPMLTLHQGTGGTEGSKLKLRRLENESPKPEEEDDDGEKCISVRNIPFLGLEFGDFPKLKRRLESVCMMWPENARENYYGYSISAGPTACLCVMSNFDSSVLASGDDKYAFEESESNYAVYSDRFLRLLACSDKCNDKIVFDVRRNRGVKFEGDYTVEGIRLMNCIKYCVAELLYHHPDLKEVNPYSAWIPKEPSADWLATNNLQLTKVNFQKVNFKVN